jgi:hypothetical protein
LSTSQPNQQAQQYMNMPRTTQTPGMNKENFLIEKNSIDLILVNFPYFAAASPTFLDPNLMMSSTRQPSGSPALRMYPQQVPIPSMSSHIPFLLISISFF